MRLWFVVSLCVACGRTTNHPSSPASFVLADEAVDVEFGDVMGPAPLEMPVRAVNIYGAAVAADPIDFVVNARAVEVKFDGLGYGSVLRYYAGSAEVEYDGRVALAHALDSDWAGFGLMRAVPAPFADADGTQPVGGGALVSKEAELWWVPTEGPAHRVLVADSPLQGFRSRDVDVDGVTDAVAWSRTTVFLLRGRLGGGMAWGAALQAPDYTVGGADVGDLNGDNLPDIAVAWAQEDGHILDIWHGDGLWGWIPAVPKALAKQAVDVGIGDNTGEGINQATILNFDGTWSRYIHGSEFEYMPIGPKTPSKVPIPRGSQIRKASDVNGNNAAELVVAGPRLASVDREILLFDMKEGVQILPVDELEAFVSVADGNADRKEEVWTLPLDRQLRSLSYEKDEFTGERSYVPRVLGLMPERGPFGLFPYYGGDSVPDLFLAGDITWWWYYGFTSPEDLLPGEERIFWWITEPERVAVAQGLVGPMAVVTLDGDPLTTQLVLFDVTPEGLTRLLIANHHPDLEGAVGMGALPLSDLGAAPLELAVCGTMAWTLLSGRLHQVDISNPTAPNHLGSIPTNGTKIHCADGEAPAAAVYLEDDAVVTVDPALAELSRWPAAGARDVAMADRGNGIRVQSCTTTDCDIGTWRWAPGQALLVDSDPERVNLMGTGTSETLFGGGAITVADVDGDGNEDLVTSMLMPTGTRIVLHRSTGTHIAPPEVFHTRMRLLGPVWISDADGDGLTDLWGVDHGGFLWHTLAPAEVVVGAIDHTGDTGPKDTAAEDTSPAHTGTSTTATGETGTGSTTISTGSTGETASDTGGTTTTPHTGL
jgi:hypothetical protein